MRKHTFDKADYDEFIAKFISLFPRHRLKLQFADTEEWQKTKTEDDGELMEFVVTSKEYVSSYLAQKAIDLILDCHEARSYTWVLTEIKKPYYKDGNYIQIFFMGAKYNGSK